MKGLVVLAVIVLFLISSFAIINAISVTSGAVNNGSSISAANKNADSGSSIKNSVSASIAAIKANLTAEQIQKITTAKNKINEARNGECPENCTCTGSTIKCTLQNGREMIIAAGNSGNIIFQVKNISASTSVTLYKTEEGKVYGVFKNNETKVVKMLPNQVRERIRERITARLQNENITLNEDGNYTYTADKQARLFFIFPVRVAVRAQIDSQTGEMGNVQTRWWAFLAKDENSSDQVVGASCGTVTPGYNDACCISKGYDFWNPDSQQCEFNASS